MHQALQFLPQLPSLFIFGIYYAYCVCYIYSFFLIQIMLSQSHGTRTKPQYCLLVEEKIEQAVFFYQNMTKHRNIFN